MRSKRTDDRGIVYGNPFMQVRHSHVDFPDHSKDYYVIEFGPRAGIVLLSEGKVLLVRQYRFLIDGFSWELPGGTVEKGEDLESGARRECAEETGIECQTLEKLLVYYPGLDNVDNRTTIFLCESFLDSKNFKGIPSEIRDFAWFPVAEAMQMIRAETILDAMTIAGIHALALARTRPPSRYSREAG